MGEGFDRTVTIGDTTYRCQWDVTHRRVVLPEQDFIGSEVEVGDTIEVSGVGRFHFYDWQNKIGVVEMSVIDAPPAAQPNNDADAAYLRSLSSHLWANLPPNNDCYRRLNAIASRLEGK